MIAIPHPVASAARARPSHRVLDANSGALTARELVTAVAHRAAALVAQGVDTSAVVGLVGPADLDWVVCFHAISWIGAVVAPLPFPSTVELERALKVLQPHFILAATGSDPGETTTLAARRGVTILANRDGTALATERFWPIDEPRLRLLTSGTSGMPQPVTLTSAQLVFNAFGSATRLGLDPGDSWLHCLPLWHVGGAAIVWRSAFYGTHVRLLPKFDALAVNAPIEARETNVVSLVPIMLERLLDARGDAPFPSSLRAILLGGAAASTGLIERCRVIHAPLCLSWGMSETASQVATAYPGEIPDDGSVGPALPFARVAADTNGQLVVEGPLAANGRLMTHDMGSIDADGRIHVDGRADDVIVSGGKKIDPIEVERVLARHASVASAVVVGIHDPKWGESPVAFLVPRSGLTLPSDAELRRICASELPRFAIPQRFFWRQQLATSALGKVARGALRSEAALLIDDVSERSIS